MTAELQGFADYGEVPQTYDEHMLFLRSFEGETVRIQVPDRCMMNQTLVTELKLQLR